MVAYRDYKMMCADVLSADLWFEIAQYLPDANERAGVATICREARRGVGRIKCRPETTKSRLHPEVVRLWIATAESATDAWQKMASLPRNALAPAQYVQWLSAKYGAEERGYIMGWMFASMLERHPDNALITWCWAAVIPHDEPPMIPSHHEMTMQGRHPQILSPFVPMAMAMPDASGRYVLTPTREHIFRSVVDRSVSGFTMVAAITGVLLRDCHERTWGHRWQSPSKIFTPAYFTLLINAAATVSAGGDDKLVLIMIIIALDHRGAFCRDDHLTMNPFVYRSLLLAFTEDQYNCRHLPDYEPALEHCREVSRRFQRSSRFGDGYRYVEVAPTTAEPWALSCQLTEARAHLSDKLIEHTPRIRKLIQRIIDFTCGDATENDLLAGVSYDTIMRMFDQLRDPELKNIKRQCSELVSRLSSPVQPNQVAW